MHIETWILGRITQLKNLIPALLLIYQKPVPKKWEDKKEDADRQVFNSILLLTSCETKKVMWHSNPAFSADNLLFSFSFIHRRWRYSQGQVWDTSIQVWVQSIMEPTLLWYSDLSFHVCLGYAKMPWRSRTRLTI